MSQATSENHPSPAETLKEAFDNAKEAIFYHDGRGLIEIVREKPEVAKAKGHLDELTLLTMAAGQGQLASCELLAPLSDLNARDVDGNTPFLVAAMAGNLPVVQLLWGASERSAVNKKGEDALILAAKTYKSQPELIALLIPASNPSRASSKDEQTALGALAMTDSARMGQSAKLLIDAGWDPFREERRGATPFNYSLFGAGSFNAIWACLSDEKKKEKAPEGLRWAVSIQAAEPVLEELCKHCGREIAIEVMSDNGLARVPAFAGRFFAQIEAESLAQAVKEGKSNEQSESAANTAAAAPTAGKGPRRV